MQIKIEEMNLEVESADSFLKRAWGLSMRCEGKMLFKFPRPTNAKIDMALLSSPLYLYFFNSDRTLIHKERAEPWSWNPSTWKFYRPKEKYQYLIESFEDLDLDKGMNLDF